MTAVIVSVFLLFFFFFLSVSAAPALTSGLVYPAYVYPGGSALSAVYGHLASTANAYPSLPVTVIVNPGNGDYNSCPYNTDWVAALSALNGSTRNLGYTYSSYGNRDITLAKQAVDNYYSCWAPPVGNTWRGIFIDEGSNTDTNLGWYCELYSYIKSKTSNSNQTQVWINPGTATTEGYVNCSDVIVTFENYYSALSGYSQASWTSNYPASRFAAIVEEVPSTANLTALLVQLQSLNFGYGVAFESGYTYTSESLSPFFDSFASIAATAGSSSPSASISVSPSISVSASVSQSPSRSKTPSVTPSRTRSISVTSSHSRSRAARKRLI